MMLINIKDKKNLSCKSNFKQSPLASILSYLFGFVHRSPAYLFLLINKYGWYTFSNSNFMGYTAGIPYRREEREKEKIENSSVEQLNDKNITIKWNKSKLNYIMVKKLTHVLYAIGS